MSKSTKRVVKGKVSLQTIIGAAKILATKKKKNTKTTKVWVALLKENGLIQNADYFSSNDCCCCEETRALAVYESIKQAQMAIWRPENYNITPATLTYQITKPKKK